MQWHLQRGDAGQEGAGCPEECETRGLLTRGPAHSRFQTAVGHGRQARGGRPGVVRSWVTGVCTSPPCSDDPEWAWGARVAFLRPPPARFMTSLGSCGVRGPDCCGRCLGPPPRPRFVRSSAHCVLSSHRQGGAGPLGSDSAARGRPREFPGGSAAGVGPPPGLVWPLASGTDPPGLTGPGLRLPIGGSHLPAVSDGGPGSQCRARLSLGQRVSPRRPVARRRGAARSPAPWDGPRAAVGALLSPPGVGRP